MRVTLCGAFGLEPRDSDAPLPGGQARQVLTYLAARSGRLVRREVLCDVLWPRAGSAPQDPDAVLSSLLSRLRPVVAPARIESSDGGVGLLLPEGSTVDVEEAAAALEQARRALAAGDGRAAGDAAARALRVAEAGFLPEQDDDWTAGPRELVQTLRLDALECEANAAVLLGGAPLAAGEQAARIAVVIAPLRESAHAALMRVLAARGNSAEALRVYERLRRLLIEELGVAPSPELRQLHERLLSGDEGVTPRALLAEVLAGERPQRADNSPGPARTDDGSPHTPEPPLARPPLPPVVHALGSGEPAGREAPLRLLHRSVARVRAEGPRAAVVLGEPGMGTSRLACLFARELYDDGAYVLFGRADPGEGGGTSALREAFAPLVDADGWDDVRWRAAAAEDGEGPWARALRDACARLVAVAREQLVVVVVDDAEALDAASARLLRVVLEAPDARLLLVLTATTSALRGGSATWHVLDRLRQVSRRDDVVLDDLDGAAVAALVADELPGAPAALGPALYDYVGGHPVLVREAVEELRGSADPLAALRTTVPRTLRASVAQRLERLGEPARRVARAVAALDGAATVGALALVLELPRERVLDAVGEAAEERLLRLERDRRHVGFRTRVERDVTIALIGRPELARDGAAAVAALDAAGAEAPLLGRLALRAIPALSADEAAERALDGIQELLERRDFAPAATLADAALAAQPSPLLRARLLVAGGEASRRVAAGPARRAFSEGLRLAQQQGDGLLAARAALGLAALGESSVNRSLGPAARQVVDALTAAERALPPGHDELRAQLLARRALERSWEPDPSGALELLDRARALLGPRATSLTRRVVEQAAIRVDADPARTEQRLVQAGRLLDEARGAHDLAGVVAALATRLPLLGELGRWRSVRQELASGRRLADQLGDARFLRWAGEAEAMLAEMAGERERAAELRAAALDAGGDQPVPSEPFALEQLFHRLHRHPDAVEPADVVALAEIAQRRPDLGAARACAALLTAAGGDGGAARALLTSLPADRDGLAALDRANGLALLTRCALATASWQLRDDTRAAALRELLEPYAERHVVVFLPGYFGPVAESLGLLELLLGDERRGRERLREARAAADSAGAAVAAARIAALLA